MTTELAYPRADALLTVGDVCDLGYGRIKFDDVQVDPTGFTVTATMQKVEGAGDDETLVGDPIAAITSSVVDDPEDDSKKALKYRIDTTTEGIEVGRWRWESVVSGDDPDEVAFSKANTGGYLTLSARLPVAGA